MTRLLVRFVVLFVTVLGVGTAFAWAWDSSDNSARQHVAQDADPAIH